MNSSIITVWTICHVQVLTCNKRWPRMLSLKRKYTKLMYLIFLSAVVVSLFTYMPQLVDLSDTTVKYGNDENQVIDKHQQVLPRPPNEDEILLKIPSITKVDIHMEGKQETTRQRIDTAHMIVHPQPPNSYRSWPHITGWMETNKMKDDYAFCPRIEPFLGPFNYDDRSKSPCWDDNGILRCIPYSYIVGFSKCGTSDLFSRIIQHPDVIHWGDKEKHWFDYHRFGADTRFIQNYTDKFANLTASVKSDLGQKGFSHKIAVDGTPCYVWGSLNWPCYEGNQDQIEPRFTNADVIYHLNPKTKIVISVREPVSRLYSRMLSWIREPLHPVYVNSTPEKFHTFIKERIQMYSQCFQQRSPRQCAYNGTLYKEAVLRLAEGAYSLYVKDWLEVFPREQLLFIKFEDYIADMNATVRKVYSFLELAPLSEQDMHKILHSGRVNTGAFYHVGPMLNKTRDMLENFYQPFNEELAQILGDPHMTWKYSPSRWSGDNLELVWR